MVFGVRSVCMLWEDGDGIAIGRRGWLGWDAVQGVATGAQRSWCDRAVLLRNCAHCYCRDGRVVQDVEMEDGDRTTERRNGANQGRNIALLLHYRSERGGGIKSIVNPSALPLYAGAIECVQCPTPKKLETSGKKLSPKNTAQAQFCPVRSILFSPLPRRNFVASFGKRSSGPFVLRLCPLL